MSNLEFAVGKRVVCVDDATRLLPCKCQRPCRGGVYTIRDIYANPHGDVALRLEEIRNDPLAHTWHPEPVEHGFLINRFRPVRETSIDCFTALLEKQPELVGCDA